MNQREKLLYIYELISDLRVITPKSKLGQVSVLNNDIDKSIDRQQLEFIFELLENDHKVIKIHTKPDYKKEFHYRYSVNDNFDEVYDKIYGQSKFGINNLEGISLLKVYDAAIDIADRLSLTQDNKVKIRICPPVIRFSQLYPADSIGTRDQYMEYRWTACQFLLEYGALAEFDFIDSGSHRWDGEIYMVVHRRTFDRVFAQLSSKYKLRTSKPSTQKQNSNSKQANVQANENTEIEYDDEHGKVTYQNKTVKLFEPATLEGYLMYRVSNPDGARINSSDIANDFEVKHPEVDKDVTTKKLNNAKKRINEKISKALKLEDVIRYEREQFWLEEKYLSSKSPYKK